MTVFALDGPGCDALVSTSQNKFKPQNKFKIHLGAIFVLSSSKVDQKQKTSISDAWESDRDIFEIHGRETSLSGAWWRERERERERERHIYVYI